jgi:hypothetical protein
MNFGITLSNRAGPLGLCGARKARLESWLTYGSPRECAEHIKRFKAWGCRRITFRISTMGDPMEQFRRLVEDVLPYVD